MAALLDMSWDEEDRENLVDLILVRVLTFQTVYILESVNGTMLKEVLILEALKFSPLCEEAMIAPPLATTVISNSNAMNGIMQEVLMKKVLGSLYNIA